MNNNYVPLWKKEKENNHMLTLTCLYNKTFPLKWNPIMIPQQRDGPVTHPSQTYFSLPLRKFFFFFLEKINAHHEKNRGSEFCHIVGFCRLRAKLSWREGIKVTRGCVMTRAKLQARHAHAYLLVHQSTPATHKVQGYDMATSSFLTPRHELGNISTHVH